MSEMDGHRPEGMPPQADRGAVAQVAVADGRDPLPAAPTPPASADNCIEIRGLSKHYGALKAVDDMTLDIPSGSVYGLIGPNGAGKSTTFSVLAGLLKPSSGTASVLGIDPVTKPREVKKRLGYMPDVLGHYDGLKVHEYLHFFASTYGLPRKSIGDLVGDLLELVDLTVKRESMVNELSRGMKQRLSLARSLVHDPGVLILDEPASGLDPRARIDLRVLIQQLNQMGKTLVISSHILSELEEMCSEVAILEAGRVLASGTPQSITGSFEAGRQVRIEFLGGSVETISVADEAEQAALLRRLVVEEGRDIVEFSVDKSGLEEIFMQVTKGIVQ
jgi:ABC-2 type transport system ATP-binding protein